MILKVRVVPSAGRNLVKEEESRLKVYLMRPAKEGLANVQLIAVLSEYLHIKKRQIIIIRGQKSRDKVLKVDAKE